MGTAAWLCLVGGVGLGLDASSGASASVSSLGVVRASYVRVGIAPRLPHHAQRLGRLPSSARVEIDVVLSPSHPEQLAALTAAVSNPRSAQYRHYLARGTFASRFGATSGTIHSLESTLRRDGLDPTGVSSDRLAIHVRGKVGALERALSTRFSRYRLPGGSTAFANDAAPLLPSSVAAHVQAVLGLNSLAAVAPTGLARVVSTVATKHPATSSAGPVASSSCVGAAGSSGYTADQIASAYGLTGLYSSGNLGAGATIGLIEFTSISTTDISTYASCYGLAYPAVSEVPVDGGPTAGVASNEVEAELDLEDVVGLAPQAKFVVYEGTDTGGAVSGNSAYDTYATAVNQDAAQVISTSWGSCEQAVGVGVAIAERTLFEQAALQGQTVVAASGDNGSEDCYGTVSGAAGRALAVDDPASQPYVTGVGGTTLQIGAQTTEEVWNTSLDNSAPGAGGGGVSTFWAMPAYQSAAPASLGVVTSNSACKGTARSGQATFAGGATEGANCRQVPDVAANAGAPYAIYCTLAEPTDCASGGWTGLGGTSAAAPTWAAVFALADRSTSCRATGPIGFANPALYAAAAKVYSAAFRDVTVGGNDLTGNNPGHYSAKQGYDLASGLGSPIATNTSNTGLVAELCAPAARAATRSQLPVPAIATVSPRTIRARAGVHVTIVGTNLAGATAVHFGARAALSFKVRTRTSIVAVAPDGVGLVHVTVTTRAGASKRASADVFDYLVRPLLYRVAPPSGPSGGRTVVLVGADMGGAVAVMFGSRPALSFTVKSTRRIVAVAPPGRGRVVVTVRTRGGTSARLASDRFSYSAKT
ncbi:MAG: hypothetical protein JWO62_421 [Acidimicrobiaceae bacterium]|nr:hypothetical protein [Acidimicrobiaceae bacterium]